MKTMSRSLRWVGSLILLAMVLLQGRVPLAESAPAAETPFPHGRMGFGRTSTATTAMVEYLNAGWYWDWAALGASRLPPLEYAQTVRLKPVFQNVEGVSVQVGYTATPTGTQLLNAIAGQPGAIWFIGNEPDCTAMDNMLSHWYARAYHDLYHFIKAADPTAQIAAGNIVQPTAQRFEYLDRVLAAYTAAYGEPLPADLWATHNYILCEKCYPYKPPGEPFAWGACWVPDWPDYTASVGRATFYSVYDHWDVDIYAQRMVDFRQWMVDNGYHYHPLLIPEYGILFYEGLVPGMTTQDDIDFMYATFDWMLTARDAALGYAPDDNRLVQRWAWFSLDHGDYPGGSLFLNRVPTPHGVAYHQYTSQLQPEVTLHAFHSAVITDALTAAVVVTASNSGNVTTDYALAALLYARPGDSIPVSGATLRPLDCCGDYATAMLPWPGYDAAEPTNFYVTVTQALEVSRAWAPVEQLDGPVTVTLYATVVNAGYVGTGTEITLTFYAGPFTDTIIGEAVLSPLACCGDTVTGSVLWPNRQEILQEFCVTAVTPYLTSAPVCAYAWISPYQFFLPVMLRQ